MGWGDEIIASGQARLLHEQSRRLVLIYDRAGAVRSHEMWRHNPRIGTRGNRPRRSTALVNGPGVRPYIAAKTSRQWTWKEWDCPVGEIYFSADEVEFARGHPPPFVVIEPNMKSQASPNKDWGRARWEALVALLRGAGLEPAQLGPAGSRVIPGARFIETPTFRHACAVLARARLAVLPEGGLHHAAAALKVKGIVLFGGFISPRQTGYASQVNLFTGGQPCGMRIACEHCAQAMAAIPPDLVMREVRALLQKESSA